MPIYLVFGQISSLRTCTVCTYVYCTVGMIFSITGVKAQTRLAIFPKNRLLLAFLSSFYVFFFSNLAVKFHPVEELVYGFGFVSSNFINQFQDNFFVQMCYSKCLKVYSRAKNRIILNLLQAKTCTVNAGKFTLGLNQGLMVTFSAWSI